MIENSFQFQINNIENISNLCVDAHLHTSPHGPPQPCSPLALSNRGTHAALSQFLKVILQPQQPILFLYFPTYVPQFPLSLSSSPASKNIYKLNGLETMCLSRGHRKTESLKPGDVILPPRTARQENNVWIVWAKKRASQTCGKPTVCHMLYILRYYNRKK